MKLFSLYLIVSATLLVQSSHSVRLSYFDDSAIPHQGYKGNAFPQSKNYNKLNPLSANEIRSAFNKLLQEATAPVIEQKRDVPEMSSRKKGVRKPKPHTRSFTNPQWEKWTDWSSCSVSCGRGRRIRWRHCRQNCEGVETEMEEKACQLPACMGKLFGFIKI